MDVLAMSRYHGHMKVTPLRILLLCIIGAALMATAATFLMRTLFAEHPLCENCNIVLVSLDVVDADSLEMGFPLLWQRAKERGVLFDNAYSSENRGFGGHAALLTGERSLDLGMTDERVGIPLDVPTVAEELASSGYRTKAFAGSSFITPAWGFDRGFLEWAQVPPIEGPSAVLLEAEKWIADDAAQENPYFLFVAPYDLYGLLGRSTLEPGFNYPTLQHASVGDVSAAEALEAGYLEKLQELDRNLSTLIDAAEASDRKTIVVVTGSVGRVPFDVPGIQIERSVFPAQSVLNVPLVVFVPNVPARTVSASVEVKNSATTLFHAVEGGGSRLPGDSLVPYLRGTTNKNQRAIAYVHTANEARLIDSPEKFYEDLEVLDPKAVFIPLHASPAPRPQKDYIVSLIEGSWHMVRLTDGTKLLYDIARDPLESTDLFPSVGALGAGARKVVGTFLTTLATEAP